MTVGRAFFLTLATTGITACGTPDETGTTGTGLYYEATGAGDVVILAHGFSLDRRMWDPQIAALRHAYRVFRYDLRGHGNSPAPQTSYTQHDDLASVVDAAGADRAMVVGLSAGAEAAIDFALAYPDRVRALVLASPGLGGYAPQGSFDWMAPVMERLRAGDHEGATRRWMETPLMAIADGRTDSLMRIIVTSNAGIWLQRADLRHTPQPPAVERLGEIAVPVLVVVGELDLPDTHAVATLRHDGIEGAEYRRVPGVGHLVSLAAPDVFNEALLSFLARVP